MAAAYSTGTAASGTALLQALVTWLVAQGWTQDASASEGTGWRAHLHKGGNYLNFRVASNEIIWASQGNGAGYGIGFYMGDGYSGAAAWNLQSGAPLASGGSDRVGVSMPLPNGAVTAYHFFDNGADHVTVVVERAPGIFVHLGWGPSLVQTGYATDFPYFFGTAAGFWLQGTYSSGQGVNVSSYTPMNCGHDNTHADCFFKVDAATFAARWIGVTDTTSPANQSGYTGKKGRTAINQSTVGVSSDQFVNYQFVWQIIHQSAFVGSLILPVHCYVENAATRWSPVGYPPTVFLCGAVGHGFGSGEVYAVGGLNYMVFPSFAVLKAA